MDQIRPVAGGDLFKKVGNIRCVQRIHQRTKCLLVARVYRIQNVRNCLAIKCISVVFDLGIKGDLIGIFVHVAPSLPSCADHRGKPRQNSMAGCNLQGKKPALV